MPSSTLKLHVIIVISYHFEMDCEITEWACLLPSKNDFGRSSMTCEIAVPNNQLLLRIYPDVCHVCNCFIRICEITILINEC